MKIPSRNRARELSLALDVVEPPVTKRAVALDDESVTGTSAKTTSALNAKLCDAVIGGRYLIVTPRLLVVSQLVAGVLEVGVGNLTSERKKARQKENRDDERFHCGCSDGCESAA